MYRAKKIKTDDKQLFYKTVNKLLIGQVCYESDWLAQLANASALLGHQMDEINWVGFYLLKNDELVLGPFQGKPACTHIPIGKGVCGTAAEKRKTILVPDVHEFPGHIACDAASQSEIVVPILKDGELKGVLDIDSPIKNRFDEEDKKGLEEFVQILAENVHWENIC
ncbi:hypothetical protein BBF96_05695 [Anoxybacter fermentans]|uniref:GAF domain-containing protein n=1 Tax=Anoxybacter fermentans TaxID=1323375 RepID=A0A3S9SXE9_9FIRM|nr:hypothetical protein BBF96_05695 [Anoxybacter fermentans]